MNNRRNALARLGCRILSLSIAGCAAAAAAQCDGELRKPDPKNWVTLAGSYNS
jgi:hypothetical protein